MTLRYLLYTDPTREHTTQLGEDIYILDAPQYAYGSPVVVDGQTYIMANLPFVKLVPHRSEPDAHEGIMQVFLATPEQWPEFKTPEIMKRIYEQETDEPED